MSGQPWDADTALSAEDAAGLIAGQFPELSPVRLRPMGAGWDNAAYLVNERWVFRFPRRQLGADTLAVEVRVLPRLAPRLPLPVPGHEHVGRPRGTYPYLFAGYRMLPGTTGCAMELSGEARAAGASRLGAFLAALHALPADLVANAPGDLIRRADMRRRLEPLIERLTRVAEREPDVDAAALRALFTGLADTPPWPGPPRWVHGDLYARHLLFDASARLCGVIDWGDVHLGDPALDLSIALSFLAPAERAPFLAAYGAVDRDTWARARFRALHYGVMLMDYGASVGDRALAAAGRRALSLAPMS